MRIELGMGTQPYAGVKVEPSEADLLTVLDTADVDHDGNISREEVLGAIGTWLQLIYQMQRDEWTRKIQEKKKAAPGGTKSSPAVACACPRCSK